MKHNGTMYLYFDKFYLRKFQETDLLDMYEYCSDEKMTKYLTWETHKNIEETKQILDFFIKEYEKESTYRWAILDRINNKIIGCIDVVSTDEKNLTFEIGYCLSSKYWKKGIMTNCLKEVIEYLFSYTDVNRIQARHWVNNPASGMVMQKSGMKFEGIIREEVFHKNEFKDIAYYSILKKEYNPIIKKEKSCGAVVYKYIDSDLYILLIKMNGGHYSFPKGHVEDNETEEQTALREIKEETNLDVIIDNKFREIVTYSPKKNVIKDVIFFVALAKNDELIAQEEEVSEVMWVKATEAKDIITFESDKQIFNMAYDYINKRD